MKALYQRILFIIIVVVLLASSLTSYQNLNNYTEKVEQIRHANRTIRTTQLVMSTITDAETAVRGYRLTDDSAYLEPYFRAITELPSQINTLDSLLLSNREQLENIQSLHALVSDKFSIISSLLSLVSRQTSHLSAHERALLAKGKLSMDSIRSTARRIMNIEQQRVEQDIDNESDYRTIAPIALLFYTLFALFGVTYLFVRILQELSRRETAESMVREEFKKLQFQNTLLEERRIILNEAESLAKMGSWKWTDRTKELAWSDGLYLIFTKKPGELVTWNSFLENVEEDDKLPLEKFLEEVKSEKKDSAIDYRIIQEGQPRYLSLTVKAHAGINSDIFGAVVDITERKKYEKWLERNNQELKRSNEDLEQFASVASHDLQEPLRKIRTFGDRLTAKYTATLGELGSDYIFRMQSAAGRMQLLIQDLLAFSKVSRVEVDYQLLQPVSILEEVLDDIDVLVKRERAIVQIGEIPSFYGDRLQVKRLFQNLIANAIKFHRAGVAPLVEIQGRQMQEYEILKELGIAVPRDEYVRMSIKDNGIGFDNKYAEQIFTIFQRLHGHAAYEGTGIGLAICRKIVANHDGYIVAKSTEQVGSEFIVIFKRNRTSVK